MIIGLLFRRKIELFRRKIELNVSMKKNKLLWKEMDKVNDCLVVRERDVRKTWKEYFMVCLIWIQKSELQSDVGFWVY